MLMVRAVPLGLGQAQVDAEFWAALLNVVRAAGTLRSESETQRKPEVPAITFLRGDREEGCAGCTGGSAAENPLSCTHVKHLVLNISRSGSRSVLK